jgi:hypothetical protein
VLKIRVGLPSYDGNILPQTIDTINKLIDCKKWDIDFRKVLGTYVCKARNAAVTLDLSHKKKQKYDWDYFLSMDADMTFSPENVERLIALDLDIVSMGYQGRAGLSANRIVSGHWNPPGDIPGLSNFECWFPVWDTGLKEADWCGMGACLIKKKVFETMEHPYFRHIIVEHGDCANEISEDMSFCIGAKAAGFKIWVDLNNRAGHLQH